jgi:hypothetical protein
LFCLRICGACNCLVFGCFWWTHLFFFAHFNPGLRPRLPIFCT